MNPPLTPVRGLETLPLPRREGPEPRRCTRCVYDEHTPGIVFDPADGVCNFCRMHEALDREYPTGEAGARMLEALAARIRESGRGRPFDCVIGVSGGCDSSYLVAKSMEFGLRPLAVHYDNTWNTKIATENITRVLRALGVELSTHVVDNAVSNDIFRATMRSGLPTVDLATDLALTTVLYRAAARHGIRYVFDAHSFRTEGISPPEWGGYVDGRLIKSVVKRHGDWRGHRLRTYPNLTLAAFLRFMLVSRIKRVRPLYYLDYHKESAKSFLADRFGWQWYGGYHQENRISCFGHTYFYQRRTGIDRRPCFYSAYVRSGQLTRDEALAIVARPVEYDPELIALVKKRLGFSDEAFEAIMTQPLRSYRDFPTYKRTFERLRPFFWLMYKLDLVPKSFYLKYTARKFS